MAPSYLGQFISLSSLRAEDLNNKHTEISQSTPRHRNGAPKFLYKVKDALSLADASIA